VLERPPVTKLERALVQRELVLERALVQTLKRPPEQKLLLERPPVQSELVLERAPEQQLRAHQDLQVKWHPQDLHHHVHLASLEWVL
jgi:hypothetical protein